MCVVGIFGKDNLGYKSKAVHLNGTIGKEVFKVCLTDMCLEIAQNIFIFLTWNIVADVNMNIK